MNNKKSFRIGIIAEDESDVDSAKVLIQRITGNGSIGVRRFVGKGCGRIKRKCRSWALTLKTKGCKYLILIHDLDRNNLEDLKKKIEESFIPSPIKIYLICIPVEEMEAWWLSDPSAIQTALNLQKMPKINGHPEQISSPKELIGKIVRKYSQKTKIYLNTKHNSKIAKHLNLSKAKTCKSFVPFFDFISKNMGLANN